MRARIVCLLLAVLVFLCVTTAAQTSSGSSSVQIKKTPAPVSDPTSGKAMYNAYCASCHGMDGKGNGPAAQALKAQPTDLTTLAAQNGGEFPAASVGNVIRGDTTAAAHGAKDMPVWGPVFLSVSNRDQAQVLLRIHNLTDYIKQLQAK